MSDASLALSALSVQPTSLAFVDAAVADSASLVSQFQPGTEVHLLDSSEDAIDQITQVLAGRSNVSAVHLVSHGSDGALLLGGQTVVDFGDYNAELQQWSKALTADADILLYGCNVAADGRGKSFVNQLAQMTGADVAASDDLTGQGGDWVLEYSTGAIETASLAAASYTSTLANFTVSNTNDSGTGSLRQAILDANAAAGADTINVNATGTITLSSELVISDDLTINGNGITISGNNASRVFNITDGNFSTQKTVSLNGLTITGGSTTGGGGGISISSLENLTVNNSTISNNSAAAVAAALTALAA